MHFEILVEGQCELTALSILLPKIIGEYNVPHTWRIHKHRGIGKLPEDLLASPNRHDQTLLHNLPAKLRAYGKEAKYDTTVIVLVDLDDRDDCRAFKKDLEKALTTCDPKPNAQFRIAIEELEAWYFGDMHALQVAFPSIKQDICDKYIQDSQCGTWEKLADAIFPGGFPALAHKGKRSPIILEQKRKWASQIAPHMDINRNESPSFKCFKEGLEHIISQ